MDALGRVADVVGMACALVSTTVVRDDHHLVPEPDLLPALDRRAARHARRRSDPDLGGLSYVEFVAPALVAATAMQTAASATTFPVKIGLKWYRTYHAVVATPVRVAELVVGVLAWAGVRIVVAASVFAVVAAVGGAFGSPLAVLAPLAALLCGLAFAAGLAAISAGTDNDQWLVAIFRFALLPLFLFSGTFFPVEQLPDWIEPVAWATPLWHGVELTRDLATGDVPAVPTAVHVAYLVAAHGGRDGDRGAGVRREAAQVSSLESTLRILPRASFGTNRSWRLVERNLVSSRDGWLVVVSGFFEPLFYLLALGIGVGALVGSVALGGESVSYREFVAPALLAASAMNGAVYESGNVFNKLKYAKTYQGVLATPLTVRDVAVGELIYTLMRGTVYSVGFVAVMLVLGLVDSPWAVLAVPGALLVSAGFAAAAVFATTLMRSWADFAFVELCTLPMFLFSTTFVPADEYPEAARWLLPLTPLYHGVHMLRAFTLGDVGWLVLVNIAYLVAMAGLFLVLADRRLQKLLLK